MAVIDSQETPERPLDVLKLLATLARHDVSYVVIGGVAVQVHGHRRTTKNLDILPAPGRDNYRRLAAALDELDARQRGVDPGDVSVSPTDAERLETAAVVPPLTTTHGEVHILNAVPGAAPYDQLRSRALVVDVDSVAVAIVGLDDLIRMKRASGQPADREDVAVLAAVQRDE